jgi:hypothetical protein
MRISRGGIVVAVLLVLAAGVGFGAGAQLHGGLSLSWFSQVGAFLVPAIPSLAAFVRTGRIKSETERISETVQQVQAQTNGTTSGLVDITGRALDALGQLARDPAAAVRARELLHQIEASAGSAAGVSPTGSSPSGTVPPAV